MLLLNVVIVWLSYWIPADIKNGIVFCRVRNALPGHRFLSLMKSDPRIDVAHTYAMHDLSGFVNDESAQNSFWYRVFYKPNSDRMEIKSAHKSYLLYRDACAISLILCGVYCMISWLLPKYLGNSDSFYGIVFLIFADGFALSANNTGTRMVTTAIAVSVSDNN